MSPSSDRGDILNQDEFEPEETNEDQMGLHSGADEDEDEGAFNISGEEERYVTKNLSHR